MPYFAETLLNQLRSGQYKIGDQYDIGRIAQHIKQLGTDNPIPINDVKREFISMSIAGAMLSQAEIKDLITQLSAHKIALNINYVKGRADAIEIADHMFEHFRREYNRLNVPLVHKDCYIYYMYANVILILLHAATPDNQCAFDILEYFFEINAPFEYYGYIVHDFIIKHRPHLLHICRRAAESRPKSLAAAVIAAADSSLIISIKRIAYNALYDIELQMGPTISYTARYVKMINEHTSSEIDRAIGCIILNAGHVLSDTKYVAAFITLIFDQPEMEIQYTSIITLFAYLPERSIRNIFLQQRPYFDAMSNDNKLKFIAMIHQAAANHSNSEAATYLNSIQVRGE
jgi:hypothetical protein